ncbi:hypothetical protein JCM10212_001563 [Sporobolomyces blumeae]
MSVQPADCSLATDESPVPSGSACAPTSSPPASSRPFVPIHSTPKRLARDRPRPDDLESDSGGSADESESPEEGSHGGRRRLRPHFFPELHLARRTFCYSKLKEHGIRSVADLGCGEGSLLGLLASPAHQLDDFPSLYPPTPGASLPSSLSPSSVVVPPFSTSSELQSRRAKLDILRRIPRPPPESRDLHLEKLVGVDLDLSACRVAAERVGPLQDDTMYRWEELTVQVYHGGAEVYNDALEGVEAVVLTEVIEHMTSPALARLPNLVFSVYAPRLVVITTPNHSFNPYFPPPSSTSRSDDVELSSRHLNRDPTGRTHRLFRDPTHEFEFTPEEFRAWAEQLQSNHADEYELTITGVGSLASYYYDRETRTSKIPFPPPSLSLHPALKSDPYSTEPVRDPTEFYATQIAIFTRKYSHEPERTPRSARPVPLPFFSSPNASPVPSTHLALGPAPPRSETAAVESGQSKATTTTRTTTPRPELGRRQSSALPLPHHLVASFTHHVRPSPLPPPPRGLERDEAPEAREIVDEVKRLFDALGAVWNGETSLSDLWRVGGEAAVGFGEDRFGRDGDDEIEEGGTSSDGEGDDGIPDEVEVEVDRVDEEDSTDARPVRATGLASFQQSERWTLGSSSPRRSRSNQVGRPSLRELVRGEVGLVVSALLDDEHTVECDVREGSTNLASSPEAARGESRSTKVWKSEWEFVDAIAEGEEKRSGMEALRIRWNGWKEPARFEGGQERDGKAREAREPNGREQEDEASKTELPTAGDGPSTVDRARDVPTMGNHGEVSEALASTVWDNDEW